MLEEYAIEEQRSVMRCCGQKDSLQRIFIKKCFLYTVGSICRLKQFTTGLKNSLKDVRNSQMMPNQVQKWLRQQFRLTGEAMGQVYECWWRICRELNVYISRF
jgi:hypothetical protein